MRELKFRAWEIEDKKYYPVIKLWFDSTVGKPDSAELWLSQNETEIADIPEQIELEQYTGLKDKNGKEIYEGDIVRYGRNLRCNTPPESRTEIVSWWSGEEEYYPCCTTSGFALPYSEDGYEVIGNIHENPELLEHKG